MFRIFCLLLGYAFGCIQTAYAVGRLTANIDIREHGSGNAGTSNVIRVIGRSAGFIVFFFDVLKAFMAYTAASLIFNGSGTFIPYLPPDVLPGLYAGLGAVVGHNYPFFLKFKGGKGIASTLGILLALDWRVAIAVYVAGAVAIGTSRFISLGSLFMTLLVPITLALLGYGLEPIAITALLTVMAFVRHRGNIGRLLAGTERTISFKKKEKDTPQ